MASDPNPNQKPTDHPGESFPAYEDGHLVSADSPEVGWYLKTDGKWRIGKGMAVNPDFYDKAVAASWGFGDGFLSGLLGGLSSGAKSGNMMAMFIGGATGQISSATATLQRQIIVARNAWCERHGVPIPGAPPTLRNWLVDAFGNPEKLVDLAALLTGKKG